MNSTRVLYTVNGKSLTLKAWSRECGVPYPTLFYRVIIMDWDPVKAITTPPRKPRLYTYDGRTQCISAWAREVGMSRSQLSKRLDRKFWDIEQALTEPLANCRIRYPKQREEAAQ